MKNENKSRQSVRGDIVFGSVLILLGIVFVLGQMFNFSLGRFLWPMYIIVPGAFLFLLSMTLEGKSGEWLASLGSLVTVVGLLLLYQNTFDHFQSWAYAWALVAPTSIGLGQVIYGSVKERERLVRNGKRLVAIGGAIFMVGGIFFELIIGISGFGLGRVGHLAWPVLLILVGVMLLLRGRWTGLNNSNPDC